MGRIIVNNLDQYIIPGANNTGVDNMMRLLRERFESKKSKGLIDSFNTYHMQALFDTK